jgi:hypothetical protein
MTTHDLLQRYALLCLANARIAAMSAENETRRFKGMAPAYDGISFDAEVQKIEAIAANLCGERGE